MCGKDCTGLSGTLVTDLIRGFGSTAPTHVLTRINQVSDVFHMDRLMIDVMITV